VYLLEAAFVIMALVLLVYGSARNADRRICIALAGGGFMSALVLLLLGQARIQMVPAVLVLAVCSALLLKRSRFPLAIRGLGILTGMALLAFSVLLTLALPIVELPEPGGPLAVGVTSFTLTDDSRDEAAFGAPEKSREIFVQAWYPAEDTADESEPSTHTLWQELYRSATGKIFFGYLSGMETHSFEGASISSSRRSYPTVVFSPALAGIAEQNTLLMEHLASHGYITLAITHPYFGLVSAYADGTVVTVSDAVLAGMSAQGSVDLEAIAARARQADSPRESAEIWLDYFEMGEALNEFNDIWVADLELLVDAIFDERSALPRIIAGRTNIAELGLIGMSFGGGAVTEFCKTDPRCRAAVNLDGGLWGEHIRQPLEVPYLVLASPGNRPFFEYGRLSSRAPYYALTVQGAQHANFTDVSAFVPLFRWLGVTGSIDGNRIIELMNDATREFLDAFVREDGNRTPRFDQFEEVELQTNQTVN
jgi:predicted dienelactone hydrolase